MLVMSQLMMSLTVHSDHPVDRASSTGPQWRPCTPPHSAQMLYNLPSPARSKGPGDEETEASSSTSESSLLDVKLRNYNGINIGSINLAI